MFLMIELPGPLEEDIWPILEAEKKDKESQTGTPGLLIEDPELLIGSIPVMGEVQLGGQGVKRRGNT